MAGFAHARFPGLCHSLLCVWMELCILPVIPHFKHVALLYTQNQHACHATL